MNEKSAEGHHKTIGTAWSHSPDLRLRQKLQRIRSHDAATTAQEAQAAIGNQTSDGDIYAGISPETNRPMYAAPEDEAFLLTFDEAAERAQELSEATGKSYRVPAVSELTVLFNNRAALGGFNLGGAQPAGWYWSSTSSSVAIAKCIKMKTGDQRDDFMENGMSVRLIRS